MTYQVELNRALGWTCDECGCDNFARMVLADPNCVETKEAFEAMRAEGCEPPDIEDMVSNPDSVTCSHCKITFDSHNFEEFNFVEAFVWTCSKCETQGFDRALVCEYSAEDGMDPIEVVDGITMQECGVHIPEFVTCQSCGEELEVGAFGIIDDEDDE